MIDFMAGDNMALPISERLKIEPYRFPAAAFAILKSKLW